MSGWLKRILKKNETQADAGHEHFETVNGCERTGTDERMFPAGWNRTGEDGHAGTQNR
jgi:hypothetical protein